MLSTAHSALHTQHCALSPEHSALNTQHWTLSTEHSALNTQHLTLSTEHSAVHTQHWTLSTAHSALNTQHCTLSTEHSAPLTQHFGLGAQIDWGSKHSQDLLCHVCQCAPQNISRVSIFTNACSSSQSYIKHVLASTVYKNSSLHMCHAYSTPGLYIRLSLSHWDISITVTWFSAWSWPELGNRTLRWLVARCHVGFHWLVEIFVRPDLSVLIWALYISSRNIDELAAKMAKR